MLSKIVQVFLLENQIKKRCHFLIVLSRVVLVLSQSRRRLKRKLVGEQLESHSQDLLSFIDCIREIFPVRAVTKAVTEAITASQII